MDVRSCATTPFDRHLAFEVAVNFRDVGGYRTLDGRSVRWRRLFRADSLSNLSRADRDTVRELGIATVIDLRSLAEFERDRFPIDEIPVVFRHLPLVAVLPGFDEFHAGPGVLASQYIEIARASGTQIARAVAIMAEPPSYPVIVHCAAGKDRTGVLVAVVLSLLGVPDETIAEDYALSAAAADGLLARILDRLPDQAQEIKSVAAMMFSATPSNITTLLDWLREEHGSIEAYVAHHGAGREVVAALREHLLE